MSCLRFVCLLPVLLLLAAAGISTAEADDLDIGREEQLKAAYLFNFVKFVEWPANENAPIRICFIGAHGIHASLTESTSGKKVGARAIAISMLEIADRRLGCDVIYLDATVDMHVLMRDPADSTALTVSDAGDFTHRGGVIRLFKEGNRLRFDINLDNARRAGTKISSNLLKLASRVEQGGVP